MEHSDIVHVLKLQNLAYELLMWLDKNATSDANVLSPERVEIIKNRGKCIKWLEADRRFFHRN